MLFELRYGDCSSVHSVATVADSASAESSASSSSSQFLSQQRQEPEASSYLGTT